jgi:hypothetical protein
MAQIDPSIALSVRPVQIESPINQMAALSQLQSAQQQQQMNALKLQEYQRGEQERNALARIHADPKVQIGSPEYLTRVAQEAPGMYESVAARAQQRAELEEKIEGRKYQNFERKFKLFQSITPTIRTIDDVTQFVTASYDDPDLGPILKQIRPYEVALTTNQDAFNQDDENWRLQAAGVSPKEIAEIARNRAREEREANKPVVVSAGGQLVSPTGDVLFSAEQKAPADPELVKEYKFATDPARGKQQFKGSLLDFKEAVARAGRTPAQGDNPNKVAHTSTDDQGNVTFYNAFGQVIRTQTNAGKRSPTLVKAEQAEKNLSRDIERTTKELAEITKDGGLIDQSTGSYAGKAVDIAARTIGMATKGDIASAKLKPIADMVLKMVPRFEGPQSDKDTQSYKEAAGQLSDSTLPPKLRKEAGLTILRLMRERKGQFAGEGMDMSPEQRRAAPPPPAGFVPDKK